MEKELRWFDELPRPDGKINRTYARDEVAVMDKYKLVISYAVCRGAVPEEDNLFTAGIIYPNGQVEHVSAASMAEGRGICEACRRKFWTELQAGISQNIGI